MGHIRRSLVISVGTLFLLWAPTAFAKDPTGSTEQADPADGLTVSEAAIATGIEVLVTEGGDLKPTGTAEVFDDQVGKLYAFTRIEGAGESTFVKHLWYHGDKLVAEVKLPVRSVNWRTYSSKIIPPLMNGGWKVDVTAEDGTLLRSLPFSVE